MSDPQIPTLAKRAYSLAEFRAVGGPAKSRLYQLVRAGKLTLVYDGKRALILAAEVDRYFASLETRAA